MKISLEGYNDLGKYCWPSSLKKFDTSRDKIYVICMNHYDQITKCEIPIESFDDLVPFLWSNPVIHYGGCDSNMLYFTSSRPKTWYNAYGYTPIHNPLEIVEKLRKNNSK